MQTCAPSEKSVMIVQGHLRQAWESWHLFMGLFGEEAKPMQFLYEACPVFVNQLNGLLRDHIILSLSKVLDRPGEGDRTNLTLPSLVQEIGDLGVQATLNARVEDLQKKLEPLRHLRDKRVAHIDRATANGQRPDPPITYKELEVAVTETRDLWCDIYKHVFGPADLSALFPTESASARQLLACLNRADVLGAILRMPNAGQSGDVLRAISGNFGFPARTTNPSLFGAVSGPVTA